MNTELVDRTPIIVWLYNLRDQKRLQKYGTIYYVSKKFSYVKLYVDQSDLNSIFNYLVRQKYIRYVKKSIEQKLDFSFDHQKELIELLREQAQETNRIRNED